MNRGVGRVGSEQSVKVSGGEVWKLVQWELVQGIILGKTLGINLGYKLFMTCLK